MTPHSAGYRRTAADLLIPVVWTCAGAACAWIITIVAKVFFLERYERMLGGPVTNLFVALGVLAIILPPVAVGAAMAQVLAGRVIQKHRTRLHITVFVSGTIATAAALWLAEQMAHLKSFAWWDSLVVLALTTLATVWCVVRAAQATRVLQIVDLSHCAQCGYDLRGSAADTSACPECGAGVRVKVETP